MPFKFNPFSGNFDQTGSGGGGGASYIDGEVAAYNDLPLSSTTAPLDSAWLVRGSSGVWPFTKPGGVYIRTATGGSSRDADYTYAGVFPDVFSDANFTLYDDSDTSKNLKFQLSGISSGTTRTLTAPNASGTIALTSDIPAAFDPASPGTIGGTTPAAATFTNLTANTRVNLPNTDGTTAGDFYRNANTLRYRDSTNTERLLLNATDNLANLASASTSRNNLGLGSSGRTLRTFTALDNHPPSTAFATLDTRNSIAVLDFDAATDENAVFVSTMPDGANLASGLVVRLHFMMTSATSGNVRWGVQFERSNTDLDSDSFDTAVEANGAANGTSGIITVTEITVTGIDGITAGDLFRLKVFRNADDATNDTATGDAELVAVDIRSAA